MTERYGFTDRFNKFTGELMVRGRFEVDENTGSYKMKADAMPHRFDTRKAEIRSTNNINWDIPYTRDGINEWRDEQRTLSMASTIHAMLGIRPENNQDLEEFVEAHRQELYDIRKV